MPFLFQRRCGPEDRAIPRNYIYACLNHALTASGLTGPSDEQLRYTPHDFRRIFVTDAIRSGLPPHIAARICGNRQVDTTLGYAAIYPEDVINHHRSFIARRRALRPSEEYREPTAQEWQDFLAHFELRKIALGVCARDFGTPCVHEHACIRCPVLRPDPEQMPRLEEIHANLLNRLQEAKEQGWLGEVAAIEASLAAAEQKLTATRDIAARHTTVHLGMPDFRSSAGSRTSASAAEERPGTAVMSSCFRRRRGNSARTHPGRYAAWAFLLIVILAIFPSAVATRPARIDPQPPSASNTLQIAPTDLPRAQGRKAV
ncbi:MULTISPECIES: site-specific integrase [Streptomyces]